MTVNFSLALLQHVFVENEGLLCKNHTHNVENKGDDSRDDEHFIDINDGA